MRFKKGSNVEVFSKKEVSTGVWLCAEVISGNGHTYSVKYGCFPRSKEPVVERVPRKAIRPCPPPPVQVQDDWVPGDLVEAFHNFSWKMARIVKVMDGDICLVRLLGLSDIWVHKSLLRVRQCWQDDKWFIVGKGDIFDMPMVEKKTNKKRNHQVGDDSFLVEKNTECKVHDVVSGKILKRRSPLGLYDLAAHPIAAQKKRLIEKGGSHQQIFSPQFSTLEKVDKAVYPNVVLGENHMNSSFGVATAEFSILEASSRNDSFLIDHTTSVDTDGCSSSVGSCNSVGNDTYNLPFRCYKQYGNNSEDYYSDAESSCQVQYEKEGCSVYSGKKSGLEFHRSELHMYCSAIEDLYALGPLSWEDEAKLTNLRHVLHISDDEHLMLLRNLNSADRMLLFR